MAKKEDKHNHKHEKGHEHKHDKGGNILGHGHHRHHSAYKNIKIVTFLNIGFTIIEFIGGALTNSLAIIADALHDLGDSLTVCSTPHLVILWG